MWSWLPFGCYANGHLEKMCVIRCANTHGHAPTRPRPSHSIPVRCSMLRVVHSSVTHSSPSAISSAFYLYFFFSKLIYSFIYFFFSPLSFLFFVCFFIFFFLPASRPGIEPKSSLRKNLAPMLLPSSMIGWYSNCCESSETEWTNWNCVRERPPPT